MARKAKPKTPPARRRVFVEDIEDEDDGPELETTQDEDDYLAFIEEIGPRTSVVEIYKHNRDGSKPHCERVSMDVLREDVNAYLRETWGAGKYTLQFKGADRRITATRTFEVLAKPELIPANGHAASNTDKMFEQHLAFMREQNTQQQTMIIALIGALGSRGGGSDPAALLSAVTTSFATLKGAAEPAKQRDLVAEIKPVLELARDLAPAPADESMGTIVREIGRGVVDSLRAGAPAELAPAGRALPPATVSVPVMAPQPAAPAQPMPARATPETLQGWLRIGLEYLKAKAKLGRPPENYVDWVLDNAEDEAPCNAIYQAITTGYGINELLQFDGTIAENPAHVRWFEEFLSEFHKALAEDRRNNDSGGPSGDGSNSPGDESPSGEGPKQ